MLSNVSFNTILSVIWWKICNNLIKMKLTNACCAIRNSAFCNFYDFVWVIQDIGDRAKPANFSVWFWKFLRCLEKRPWNQTARRARPACGTHVMFRCRNEVLGKVGIDGHPQKPSPVSLKPNGHALPTKWSLRGRNDKRSRMLLMALLSYVCPNWSTFTRTMLTNTNVANITKISSIL